MNKNKIKIAESKRLFDIINNTKQLTEKVVKPTLTEAVVKTKQGQKAGNVWRSIAVEGAKYAVKKHGGKIHPDVITMTAARLKEAYGKPLFKALKEQKVRDEVEDLMGDSWLDDMGESEAAGPGDFEEDVLEVDPTDDEVYGDLAGMEDEDFDFGDEELSDIEFDEDDFDDDEGYVPSRGRGGADDGSYGYGGDRFIDPDERPSRRNRWD